MKIERPRLLAASLAVAVVVSLAGGYVWSRTVADGGSDAEPDAVLTDPQDRTVPSEPGLEPLPVLTGDALPDVTLSDRDGNDVSTVGLLDGRPLVVNFWFSTCIPCERELADFAEVDAEVADEVRFVGVNTIDPVPVMERFAAERGVEYELFSDDRAEFQTELGIAFFPYTLFVTSDGEIIEQTGVLDADGLRAKVDSLLERES